MKSIRRSRARRSDSSPRVPKLPRDVEAAGGPRPGAGSDVQRTSGLSSSTDSDASRLYPNIHDLAQLAFFTLDRRGRICELNEKGATLLGFPASWLLGKAF